MLPENTFPVTGGIMQTEEVVPRAQSTGLDDSVSDRATPFQQSVRFAQHVQYPLPPFVNMAVKQEPQEDDERGRQPSTLSPQTEIEDVQSLTDSSLNYKRAADQSNSEFDSSNLQCSQQNGCKKSASRGRRKSRWKLKFHHQALPPEYLDHYEAALAQEAALNSSLASTTESRIATPVSIQSPVSTFVPAPNAVVDVQSWLQRLAVMQNEIYPNPSQTHRIPNANLCQTTTSRRSVITSTQSTQPTSTPHPVFNHQTQQINSSNYNSQRNNVQQSSRPPMKYSDLPYMGEITLDNNKPRRGRKPKKADICHLIYKNYGTILPGTPGMDDKSKSSTPGEKSDSKDAQLSIPVQRTDIQNRISSLLEKRLTQERRVLEISVDSTKEQEEPLNLCIRDLNLLKIRLNDKNSNAFGSCHSKSEGSSDTEDVEYLSASSHNPTESEYQTESNGDVNNADRKSIEPDSQVLANNNDNRLNKCNSDSSEINGTTNDFVNNNNEVEVKQNSGFLYWPNAGVFIHPVALQSQFLYYQKLAQERGSEKQATKEQRIVPKSICSLVDNDKVPLTVSPVIPPVESASSLEAPVPSTPSPRPKRNSAGQVQSSNQPMKRKRSAIFIPPMPTENNNNPATEVSICKFKFTGGAKPTLQEKKSLSVDSGGNFRYYSGTGDKNMRGYEFFPRESLQQPASQAGASSTGAFLSAAAERIPQASSCPRPCNIQDDNRKKRKTRKSIQREKLEQTFKEKGFLIQTQQLESAEGATYCKFRQLRKFTRYLFRSWKDYLPGNVRELTDTGEPIVALKDVEQDPEGSSTSPQPISNPEFQQNFVETSPPSLSLN